MKSKFGEKYDLIVDIISHVAIIGILYKKYYINHYKHIIIFVIYLIVVFWLFSFKSKCGDQKNLKEWEKNIRDKADIKCNNNISFRDPGFNYLVGILVLIYTFYYL